MAYGSNGFPWTAHFSKRNIDYKKGICPVAEKLQEKTYIGFGICQYELSDNDVSLIIKSFKKVWNNLDELRD